MPATPLPVSANVASLLASSNFAGFRSTLGLGSAALVATSVFDAAGAAAAAQSASQPLNSTLTSWAAVARASGVDTFLTTPSSTNLRALITDESGTGALLFAGGALGAATAISLNGNFFTVGSSTYTGTAGQTYTFPTTNATIARTDSAQTLNGIQTIAGSGYIIGASGYYFGSGGSATGLQIGSGIGQILFYGDTAFSRLQFQGTSSSNASIGISGTTITMQRADGSAGGTLVASGTLAITGVSTFGAQARLKGYTVATLPAGTQGDTAFVTDALTPTFLTVVVGGGAVVTTVFYNGTNWLSQ